MQWGGRKASNEETPFHTVVSWDRLAETAAGYVQNGEQLYADGRLWSRPYQDEEGKESGVAEYVYPLMTYHSSLRGEEMYGL